MEPWALEVLETRADGLCIYPHQLPDTIAWYFERGPLCGSLCFVSRIQKKESESFELGRQSRFSRGLTIFHQNPASAILWNIPQGRGKPYGIVNAVQNKVFHLF